MKKFISIYIIVFSIIIFPVSVRAGACAEKGTYKIIEHDLACVKVSVNCQGKIPMFYNTCDEDVYYTGLTCESEQLDNYVKAQGFKIIGNEVLLSQDTISNLAVSVDKKNFGKVHTEKNSYLPCKADESFYDQKTKQMTVQFRKGDEIYQSKFYLPDAPLRVNSFFIPFMDSLLSVVLPFSKYIFLLLLALFIHLMYKKNKKQNKDNLKTPS